MANFSDSIEPVRDLGGAFSFPISYAPEEALQTFNEGTPVQIKNTDGGLQAWDGVTITLGIAGIATQNANNLATTGAGLPQGFSPVLSFGSVIGNYAANPNQSLAQISPPMVPFSEGYIYFLTASPHSVFIAKLGTSATSTPSATANQQVGQTFGLTKDANGYWYVDINKTGVSACVLIVAIDPREAVGTVGGHVQFQILPASAQVTL